METFPCLKIAIEAMERGGNAPCVMNAANEIAVDAFLKKKIGFNQIPEVINSTLAKSPFIANPTFEDYVATDRESRALATQMTESNRNTTNFTPSNTNN